MMENNNTTYSNTSTPRSQELVECETDEHLANPNPNPNPNSHYNYKVKLMCSYGGKILPRPHDNQLAYIGGHTKILTVHRNIRYASISNKLNSLITHDHDHTCSCFKYQLPGEDLDALISVTNDEDLEHMMTEYDRIFRSSMKPVRMRLFLFSLSTFRGGRAAAEENNKAEQQWFVDALNAVRISSAPPVAVASESTDFLFGSDHKGNANAPPPALKVHHDVRLGSECGSEDSNSKRHLEIQRQMMQQQQQVVAACSHEQAINIVPRAAYYGDYYTQKIQPCTTTTYWHDQRHVKTSSGGGGGGYLISSSTAGVYPAAASLPPPATQQVSQGQTYYGMQQRMVNAPPEFYREATTIGMVRPQAEIGYYYTTDIRQAGLATLSVNQEGKMVVNPP